MILKRMKQRSEKYTLWDKFYLININGIVYPTVKCSHFCVSFNANFHRD